MYSEKPNYDRKIVIEMLYKLEFKLGEEYDDINFSDIFKWCNNVINKTKNIKEKIKIDIRCENEDTGGCGDYYKDVIILTPFYERKETDTEYNERIAKEEKEYNEYLQVKKLKIEQHSEYLKDLEEYLRIKNKYHF